jgi:transposase InsO family protein
MVWSWDITYLRAPIRGTFFYLYMLIDVWSRKIVGWEVHFEENADLATELIQATYNAEGVSEDTLVLHSDNGAPMKAGTTLAKLQELGVAASFSRPSVSNDNPYSESCFRTVKSRPNFPIKPFESLEAAREWVAGFVTWYNTEHLHSAINFLTPSERHTGKGEQTLRSRARTYKKARARHPERWSGKTRDWSNVAEVTLNPTPEPEEPTPV